MSYQKNPLLRLAAFLLFMILKRGDRSTSVALWQGFLVRLGYTSVTPDADFGPATEAATRSFQIANDLRGDGIVGDNTIAAAQAKGFAGFATDSPQNHSEEKLILVSAGHSTAPGGDRGAAGNGYVEANLAVDLRDAVALELRRKGKSVIEDGADGVSEPLKKAIVLAKKADVAVEIHWNAGPSTATGVEVLSKPKHKSLAQALAAAIHHATNLPLRGDRGWKSESSGQHHRLGFISDGNGLIIEICFISNRSDMVAYQENKYTVVKNLAEVLARQ